MSHLLLVGAGFSRNWGGWLAAEAFEYLLGSPEISNNEALRALLWASKSSGGFEDALANLQQQFVRCPDARTTEQLTAFQGAVARMFRDMNKAFIELPNWEFQQYRGRTVGEFLSGFDAIFTLN